MRYWSEGGSSGSGLWVRFQITKIELDKFLGSLGKKVGDLKDYEFTFDPEAIEQMYGTTTPSPSTQGLSLPAADSEIHGPTREVAVDFKDGQQVTIYTQSMIT
ncbi:hypothetical protein QMK19_40835 [Streptomyces sp. H10-C2]|uniref:hypothetical protein n=1 Tax=unclassified Streptomyces TaxID=2593676 RepID=UPI0024BA3EBA|nr:MULTISPECIES: hypothetical protein [unclassified Streptomyces]MDJ0347568.1 hypothetical protein [Streptomyces sp. PH10-H1]MDJ0375749.1 hypothetical protein [Streptomyces sp. H10-C2]